MICDRSLDRVGAIRSTGLSPVDLLGGIASDASVEV